MMTRSNSGNCNFLCLLPHTPFTLLQNKQISDVMDTGQLMGQEETGHEMKVKQVQEELEVIDQQITALNPLLHLDTLRQRSEEKC